MKAKQWYDIIDAMENNSQVTKEELKFMRYFLDTDSLIHSINQLYIANPKMGITDVFILATVYLAQEKIKLLELINKNLENAEKTTNIKKLY